MAVFVHGIDLQTIRITKKYSLFPDFLQKFELYFFRPLTVLIR